MSVDLEQLKQAALAATPGPWEYFVPGDSPAVNSNRAAFLIGPAQRSMDRSQGFSPEDAAHMALANPAAVLLLIERLERAEAAAPSLPPQGEESKLGEALRAALSDLVDIQDAIGLPEDAAVDSKTIIAEIEKLKAAVSPQGGEAKAAALTVTPDELPVIPKGVSSDSAIAIRDLVGTLEKHDGTIHRCAWHAKAIRELLALIERLQVAEGAAKRASMGSSEPVTIDNAPFGTKAPSSTGGHWYRTQFGWHWGGPFGSGGTFLRPGADWTGELISPPSTDAKDAERLEWVIENRIYLVQGNEKYGWCILDCSNGLEFLVKHAPTFRAAIDAAIAAKEPK